MTITSPTSLAYLNITPTTVNGTVSDPTATVVVNGIPAPQSAGQFSVTVPLAEGPNILTATATSSLGAVATASITVTLDTTPPHVTITSPPDQFITTSAAVSVVGNVNDIVVGTVNSQQATVTINGAQAQVPADHCLALNRHLQGRLTDPSRIRFAETAEIGPARTHDNYPVKHAYRNLI